MSDTGTGESERFNREVRAAISQAISHMETIEPGLHEFDAEKNREARERLDDVLDSLRERSLGTDTDH